MYNTVEYKYTTHTKHIEKIIDHMWDEEKRHFEELLFEHIDPDTDTFFLGMWQSDDPYNIEELFESAQEIKEYLLEKGLDSLSEHIFIDLLAVRDQQRMAFVNEHVAYHSSNKHDNLFILKNGYVAEVRISHDEPGYFFDVYRSLEGFYDEDTESGDGGFCTGSQTATFEWAVQSAIELNEQDAKEVA